MGREPLHKITNARSWVEELEFFDDQTNAAAFKKNDATTHPTEIILTLRDKDSGATVIECSKSGGSIVVTDDGIATLLVGKTTMRGIAPKTYDADVHFVVAGVPEKSSLGEILVWGPGR